MKYSEIISVSAIAIALSGCSSVALDEPTGADLETTVYADLTQEADGWAFNHLSNNRMSGNGISVNLDNGKPFLDTKSYKCTMWLWNPYHSEGNLKSCSQATFRGAEMTDSSISGYLLMGGLTVGVGWVLGLMPLESQFRWEEYNAALSEAYRKAGLTPTELKNLSAEFHTVGSLQDQSREVCRDMTRLEEEYQQKYESLYLAGLAGRVEISDKSGFLPKFSDIDPASWVSGSIEIADVEPLQTECSSGTVAKVPASPGRAIVALEKIIDRERSRLSTIKENRQRYTEQLAQGGVLNIRCTRSGHDNRFQYTSECDSRVDFTGEDLVREPRLEFSLNSRDFSDVMPRSYNASDSNIAVELNGGTIRLHNRTNKYVNIEALSLYFNNNVLTRSGGGSSLYELAPGTFQEFNLARFNLNDLQNDFQGLTLDEAEKQMVQFGISAKYRISEIDYSKTLHQMQKYSLVSLL